MPASSARAIRPTSTVMNTSAAPSSPSERMRSMRTSASSSIRLTSMPVASVKAAKKASSVS